MKFLHRAGITCMTGVASGAAAYAARNDFAAVVMYIFLVSAIGALFAAAEDQP